MTPLNLIAIDGPAASGKTTLAEIIAQKLGYFYFDTGVMYRATTLVALEQLGRVDDEKKVSELANQIRIDVQAPTVLDDRRMDVIVDGRDVTWEIRTPLVDRNVSKVSAYRDVRTALTEQQRRIGDRGNMVMVGRDIGTVVFPMRPKRFTWMPARKNGQCAGTRKVNTGEVNPPSRMFWLQSATGTKLIHPVWLHLCGLRKTHAL